MLTLYFNAIPCVEPVAAIVRRDRSSVLISTSAHDLPDLEAWLQARFAGMQYSEKRFFAATLGTTVGRMHARNIRHAELVCSLIKVGQDPLRFIFLPSFGVRQRRSLACRERWSALIRLERSLPVPLGRTLKLVFLKAYAAAAGDDYRRVAREGGC